MEWLNYHHLFYFWKVLRTGSITRACEELRLAPPTISAQLRSFEENLGEKLLTRSGRKLVPTEMGQMVFRYADEIFALGQNLMDAVKQRPTGKPMRLVVGVDDVLPKEIAQELIEPALHLPEPVVPASSTIPRGDSATDLITSGSPKAWKSGTTCLT